MNRLLIKSPDIVQKTIERLHGDFERRIAASPPGQCPVDLSASFEAVPFPKLRKVYAVPGRAGTAPDPYRRHPQHGHRVGYGRS